MSLHCAHRVHIQVSYHNERQLFPYIRLADLCVCVCVCVVWSLSDFIYRIGTKFLPVPVAARSKAYVCGRSPAEIVDSNPTGGGAWMSVCCECCVLSGRGLYDELITCSEESYRLRCAVVCDLETS